MFLYLCLTLAGSCKASSAGKVTETLEDDMEEEDTLNSRLEKLLGTMKEDFLRMLNLSGVPQEQKKVHPPPFMMELYNKYASDKSSAPRSDVIRSFVLQGEAKVKLHLNHPICQPFRPNPMHISFHTFLGSMYEDCVKLCTRIDNNSFLTSVAFKR